MRHHPRRLAAGAATVAILAVLLAAPARSREGDADDLLRFGTEMARQGNWREALFRWSQGLRLAPGDARLANNLAVAHEVLGEAEPARDMYRKALDLAPADSRIVENAARASRAWRRAGNEAVPLPPAPDAPKAKERRKDAVEVDVALSMPPRLALDGVKTLLVASFLVEDSDLLDTNREIVRFVRGEFRKHTALQVLDVTPPPAVPEQTLEDMAANAAFWTHMGREFGADVIVSGRLRYTRKDASGFKDVDIVSPETGQKIRETRFVEQERFDFDIDVLFFRGATGELLFKDRLRRDAVFPGLSNDPITAFYRLSETIASDVLAVVSPRKVPDVRYLFRG